MRKTVIFNNYADNPYRLYIPIVNDDDCVEGDEYFGVALTTDMDECVDLLIDNVIITIEDDDCEYLILKIFKLGISVHCS